MMGVPGGPPPAGGPCKHTDSAYSHDQNVLPKLYLRQGTVPEKP